ncbi:enolase C-terminal domain-like protein [Nonomuraea sp. NPDC049784]|uniref:enolase C-terminal domain-like protein n=1 Tax=Nonomuraea sp. NPDC049784 TaxID=3154361 RepID=UPI0033F97FBB
MPRRTAARTSYDQRARTVRPRLRERPPSVRSRCAPCWTSCSDVDFARVRIPTLGSLTPARKLAALCELRGVRLAPHGPADVRPVAQAATLAMTIGSHAFGVQESAVAKSRQQCQGILCHKQWRV